MLESQSPQVVREKIERQFQAALLKLTGRIGEVVAALIAPEGLYHAVPLMQTALREYAELIVPWAARAATTMLTGMDAVDKDRWRAESASMTDILRNEVNSTPIGDTYQRLLKEQIAKIQGIPLHAADRMDKLLTEHLLGGYRGDALFNAIMATEDVSRSYAAMLARTGASTAATSFYQARAQFAGSSSFTWNTVEDSEVRSTHAALNGQEFRWDAPPECDPGIIALPGCSPNCRCYPKAIFDEEPAIDAGGVPWAMPPEQSSDIGIAV